MLHYAIELEEYTGDYSWPVYCETEHKHIVSKEIQNDWNNGYNNVERQEGEYLLGTKWDDKHSSSE